jgi:hypothetical protein
MGIAIAYTVAARLPDEAVRSEYVEWLTSGHVQQVLAAGASEVKVLVLDGVSAVGAGQDARLAVEVRYLFSSREQLDRYLAEDAPRLRAEGLVRFGPERLVSFSRSVGAVVFRTGG